MKKLMLFAVCITASALLTQARVITIYTFNGKSNAGSECDWLGAARFASDSTWTVGNQTWSDAVQTDSCSRKADFWGGDDSSYYVDCRSNPEHKGNFFSWTAVVCCQQLLCPAGWRVPSIEDFIDLDMKLRGSNTDTIAYCDLATRNKYLYLWGGSYSSLIAPGVYIFYSLSRGNPLYKDVNAECPPLSAQENAAYWSLSEQSAKYGYTLGFDGNNRIYPQDYLTKYYGLALRCVK